jgi:serine O-acetyltransferase
MVSDSYAVMALTRVRQAAVRYHVPGLNRVLRFVQQGFYGIEIGKGVSLGEGIYIVHSLGTVIGGTSRVGRRVKFMGNNTVGTAKDNGCPVIEDDVVVGCGARILGPVRVGARARIGANAVVLDDVPPDSVVVGIPARPVGHDDTVTVKAGTS